VIHGVVAVISVTDLRIGYGTREVLRGVTAEVRAGELVAIVGPNGAGKTTLLRAMAGLLAATSGEVRAFGADPARTERRALARRLAYLPQRYELAFPFTVGEVVLMGRYAHRRVGFESEADLHAARAAMERCDVLGLETRRFDELSGGEQRRALLAQALCQQAEALLLDEPTAALDPAHARALLVALRAECERGAAAVVVTHDLSLAVRWGHRLLLLAGGELVAAGDPGEVLASEAAARAFDVTIHVGTLPSSGIPFAVPT
jgi:iron complex transport system ATP-binding protein